MEQSELQALADKLDRLIERCRKLERDNAALRELQDDWDRERAQLMHKNDLAKNRTPKCGKSAPVEKYSVPSALP